MLNKLTTFARQYDMIQPGDRIICAVSGGADSVALLFGLYLLKEKLGITLEAAHFNHGLRGEESDRDEAFVRSFCDRYDIPLHTAKAQVTSGKKGLEAAARDARYGFLRSLPGKIATAHTADDNAETVLMHMVRGTGLKGLCGITPVHGTVIRPMLTVTRQEVEAFLQEYYVDHIEDSSNAEDLFLRNRIRHAVMPLLTRENPKLAESLSGMALRLRKDEEYLSRQADFDTLPEVETLRSLPEAVRSRVLERFLKQSGVPEPEEKHIAMVNALVFSANPSAKADFPGGIVIARQYHRLQALQPLQPLEAQILPCPGTLELPGYRVTCEQASALENSPGVFTVKPEGSVVVRSRRAGDTIRLAGGTRQLKKLYIDRKIPAHLRSTIPVVADTRGVLGVYGIGTNTERTADALPAVTIRIEEK